MKYTSEDELKKVLAIDSWRNLSKDKMFTFAAMMPDIDTELAFKLVEQFPVFKSFALDALDVMEKRHESTLSHNKESQENVHRAFREIRAILKGELEREDLSADERKHILGLIMETGNREFAEDSENKEFMDRLLKTLSMVALAALGLGVVFVGGKVMLQGGDGVEGEPQS